MDLKNIFDFINSTHKIHYELIDKLSGGYQNGAYQIIDNESQQKAVLKLSDVKQAAPLVSLMRSKGYPLPELYYWGIAPDDVSYNIQEFIEGQPLQDLPVEHIDQIIHLNDLQANINVKSSQNWSEFAYNVVFNNKSNWHESIKNYSLNGKKFIEAIDIKLQKCIRTKLLTVDFVHGDFIPDNIMVSNNEITGIIDFCSAGCGTRLIDLANLFHFAYLYNYGEEVKKQIFKKMDEISMHEELAICLAYRIMAMLDFAIKTDDTIAFSKYIDFSKGIVSQIL